MNTVVGRIFKFILTTKLFWGLAVLYATGVILSPVNNKGVNIFLSPGNQADVLRQVSNNGIIAVGMTLVILTGGIDLSVGSMMALGSVICAMLLTQQGWTNASLFSIPILAVDVRHAVSIPDPFDCHEYARRGASHQPKSRPPRSSLRALLWASFWPRSRLRGRSDSSSRNLVFSVCLLPCRLSGLRWAP